MPLVKLDRAYPHTKLDRVVRRKKSEHKVINKEIAKALGVSERGILYKRKHGYYTFDELLRLFDSLQFSDEDIVSVFRR